MEMFLKKSCVFPGLTGLGFGLAVALAYVPAAIAAGYGDTATCTAVNSNRFQCNFPSTTSTRTIQYVSMQCGSTGTAYSLQEFQFLATPPNQTTEVAYQIQISNQASLGGVVSAGHPAVIYVRPAYAPKALIDLTPAPTGTTQCTVSFSGD